MNWVRGEKLGHGSFATVSLAAVIGWSSGLPPLMAVKSCGFSHSQSLMTEKLILDELKDCPEIIQCFGESILYENGDKLYNLLLEFAFGGSLKAKLMNSYERRLPKNKVRLYAKALINGLHYIHKSGYVHYDNKLQNILLDGNTAKIADFGLAKRVGPTSSCELRGTPMYMSPEMVCSGEQGPAADIWAAGCATLELLFGSPAWRCSDLAALLMRIGGGNLTEIPCELSEEGRDFLETIFMRNPAERWTAEMLLNHAIICDGATSDDGQKIEVSTSPKGPLDFPDCVSSSITCLPSPEYDSWFSSETGSGSLEERLLGLVSGGRVDWSDSDDWITIR